MELGIQICQTLTNSFTSCELGDNLHEAQIVWNASGRAKTDFWVSFWWFWVPSKKIQNCEIWFSTTHLSHQASFLMFRHWKYLKLRICTIIIDKKLLETSRNNNVIFWNTKSVESNMNIGIRYYSNCLQSLCMQCFIFSILYRKMWICKFFRHFHFHRCLWINGFCQALLQIQVAFLQSWWYYCSTSRFTVVVQLLYPPKFHPSNKLFCIWKFPTTVSTKPLSKMILRARPSAFKSGRSET